MHAHHPFRVFGDGSDIGYGYGACIACKYSVLAANGIKLKEDMLLYIRPFNGRLYDKIGVLTVAKLRCEAHIRKNGISFLAAQLALGHAPVKACFKPCPGL